MTTPHQRLEEIQIKEPCAANWAEMKGSEQRRYCDECDLHVQNLSAMKRDEAEATLSRSAQGEKLCVRVEYLPGGECVTADTPASVRTGPGRLAAAALALGASLAACTSPESSEIVEEDPVDGQTLMLQGTMMTPGSDVNDTHLKELDVGRRMLGRVALDPVDLVPETLGEPVQEIPPTLGEVCPPNISMGTPGPAPSEDD